MPNNNSGKTDFTNFDSRMKDFGVEVRMLSRFVRQKKQKYNRRT